MRLKSISIEGFRGFVDRQDVDLDADVIILHGPNGAGKTSLLDAILWALTGRIDRFAGEGDPVSLYAREGIARVELHLTSDLSVIRLSDGTKTSLRVTYQGQEFDGTAAEDHLADLLLPHLKERAGASQALSKVLTRSVYLQQDLVRQFVESDSDADRFALLSEVIGAGVVLELQQTLEKSRVQWARSTSSLRRDSLDPISSRISLIEDQLARLDLEPAAGSGDARGEADAIFAGAQRLIGPTHLSVTEPPYTSAGLDRLLKEIAAERSRLERHLATIIHLSTEMHELAQRSGPSADAASELEKEENELNSSIAALEIELEDGFRALSQRRQEQLEDANRASRSATLAALALEDLGPRCPVCSQSHDITATAAHLRHLIAVSEAPRDDLRDDERRLEGLNAERGRLRQALELIRGRARASQDAQQEIDSRVAVATARLSDLGIEQGPNAESELSERRRSLQQRLTEITELLRGGERLSLIVVRLGEQRRRSEMMGERDNLVGKKQDLTRQIEEQEKTHALAGRIIDGLREASLEVTKRQVETVAPLFQRIYSRIDPHPTFRVTQIVTKMERGKGLLRVGISDPDQSSASHDAMPILSSSQLNSFAVSLFLSLNLALPSLELDLTILDDPLQSLDAMNLLGLVDVLRRFRYHRQIIVSTHETRLLGLLQRKLRPVREGERMLTLAFEPWTKAGPEFRVSSIPHDTDEAKVLAA